MSLLALYMSRKAGFKKEVKPIRNSLQIRRPQASLTIDDSARDRNRGLLQQLHGCATYAVNSRNTDGELSAGVTTHLKSCVRQQLDSKRPADLKLFSKRQTGSMYSAFEPINGKKRPTNINRSGQKQRSIYQEILEGDRVKRFHTEKVSLNPSEKNIIKKRRLSFGKDGLDPGRQSDLRKQTIMVDQRKRPTKSVDKIQDQALYNRAVELLAQNKVKQALRDFELLVEENSAWKANSYLWLSICYKKLSKFDQAIEVLNKAIIEYPKHYQAYVYRGKLLTKIKRFDRAKKDFNFAIGLEPDKALAYMSKGDCLRANNQFKEAEKAYEKSIQCEKGDQGPMYMKKVQMLLDQMQFDNAIKDINDFLKQQPNNSEALSLKGIAQKSKGLLVEATLTFEQSLKHNNSKKGVSRSLYELVKLKMEQRDYYQAYYALSRCEHLDVDADLLQNFRLFNEATILLMKRKFQDAIKVFDQLQQLEDTFDDFLKPLFHQFKAYGYFCLGKHKQALQQYKCLDFQTKEEISLFNQYLCEGILEVERNHYRQGCDFFKKAKDVFPNKVQPYIYTAVTHVKEANDHFKNNDPVESEKRRHAAVVKALQEMNSGNLINDANSNLLYNRTILTYYFKDFKGGLEDINRCIEKAQDNIPKYFYLRGLGYACTKQLVKAINQFSICTSLDKNYSQAYVQRAKCLFLIGDTDKAFLDLHSYMELQSQDLGIHKWIGDLLFQSKSYNDALKTYCQIEDIYQNQEIVLMRIRCRVRLCMFQEARADLNWLAKNHKKFSKTNKIDMSALTLLSSLVNRQPGAKLSNHVKKLNQGMQEDIKGQIFKLVDCMMLMGIAAIYLSKYSDALSSFMLARQLFEINLKKNKCQIRSEVSEEYLNLSLKKINFNIFLMRVAERKVEQAIDFARTELMPILDSTERDAFYLLLGAYELNEPTQKSLIFCKKSEASAKFEPLELQFGSVMLKAKPLHGMFHEVCNELYPYKEAFNMIELLTPVFVQDKPQAPWIRRNNYGVVFTEDLLKNESIKLQTTELEKSEANPQAFDSYRSEEEKKYDRRNFRQKMKLDDEVEQKLKRMFKNTPENH